MFVEKDKVEAIRKFDKRGWTPETIAQYVGVRAITVRHVIANPDYAGSSFNKTADDVLKEMSGDAKAIADLEAKLAELKRGQSKSAPARVVEAVEAAEQTANPERLPIVNSNVPAVTINPRMPQPQPVFTTTFRPPNADEHPDRSEPRQPSTARGTTFNLFTGRPE